MEVIDIRMTFYLYIFKMKLQLVILIHWNFWTGANCWKRSMFCFYLLLFFFPSKVCIFENTNSITFSKIFFRILIGNKSLQCNKNQVPNKLSGLNMFFFFFNSLLHDVCEQLAEWYFQDGRSVRAACCHLAVDNVKVHTTIQMYLWTLHVRSRKEKENDASP